MNYICKRERERERERETQTDRETDRETERVYTHTRGGGGAREGERFYLLSDLMLHFTSLALLYKPTH